MKYLVFAFVVTLTIAGPASSQIAYPPTRTVPQVDTYFGTQVSDPYRWLENVDSADVHAWVEAENTVTEQQLSQIPYREKLRKRLEQLYNYPRISAPHKVGDYYFFFKNNGLQNQSVMYRQRGLDGAPEVFLDPNTLSADGTASLGATSFSHDDRYLAYSIHKSGSDWEEIFVRDVATGRQLPDRLQWARYSSPEWFRNGFFYERYDAPRSGQYTASSEFQKIYYHRLGTLQSEDVLVYQDSTHKDRVFGINATEDEKYIFLYINQGGEIGNLISWKRADETEFHPLVTEFGYNCNVVDAIGDKFLMVTDEDAPTNRAVLIDPARPHEYETILPAKAETLDGLGYVGGKIIASYMKDAANHAYVYDSRGHLENEVTLPGFGTVSGFDGKRADTEVFYTFAGFTAPPTIYRYNLNTKSSTLFHKTDLPFNLDDFVTEQVFYTSKDGTRVPMFIVHKKDMVRNGQNPTKLYAYGGFDISLTPHFSPSIIAFIEQGGIYAQPNIRGGGEYGKAWHEGGMKLHKQNVFDDFIAAADYLVAQHYTSHNKLAIEGGSNGGLLIGAVMCQRPDLAQVALPEVGVMDMLRYQKFTIGWGWASEYGTSDDSLDFSNLYRYSPLHNLRAGVQYPATLVSTADHDDRVVPGHSFKFIATLQHDQAGPNPVLIEIETKAGHGGGKPLTKILNETADQLAFTFYHLGVNVE